MRRLIILTILFLSFQFVYGSQPQTKMYDKQKDLIDGKIEAISVNWKGEIFIAPKTHEFFNTQRPLIWDFVVGRQGNLYVATGDGAKVVQIDGTGKSRIISEWQDVEA